jgi:hypothetical protein
MRNVFLSSVGRDLREYRQAVYAAIEGLEGYHCVRMEDFGSWDVDPDAFCRNKVGQCDLFICLAGPLYGSLTPAGPSYTEREFDAALEHRKTCLVFLTSEDFPLPSNLIEPDDKRKLQQAFRERISNGRIVVRFSNPAELATRVVQAIRNWESSRLIERPLAGAVLRLRREGVTSEPLEFSDPFVSIGRGPQNLVRLEDPDVSWEHGQIVFERGTYHYRHLSETNPTVIVRRGKEIALEPGEKATTMLQTQDRLNVGSSTFIVEFNLMDVDDDYVPTTKRRRAQQS